MFNLRPLTTLFTLALHVLFVEVLAHLSGVLNCGVMLDDTGMYYNSSLLM